jgi:hypothetical protein
MMPNLEIPNLTDSQKLYKGMVENLITVNSGLNNAQEEIKVLNKVVLDGNGELPIRETVRNHEVFIKDLKYWIRLVGGAILLQTLAFAIGLVVALVRFLPVLERIASQP